MEGRGAAHLAVESGHLDLARELIAAGAASDLFTVCALGERTRLARLLDQDPERVHEVDPVHSWTPLHWAARAGAVDTVRLCFERDAAIDAVGRTGQTALCLDAACLLGRRDDVVRLMAKQAPERPWSTLTRAAEGGHVEVVELLHDRFGLPPYPESILEAPLHAAARAGRLDMVRWLLEHGVDASHQAPHLWPSLHYAASGGHVAVMRALIDAGAERDATDARGRDALHHAAPAAATWLLDEGADTLARDHYGGTPLHAAAEWGRADVARILLQRGADVNAGGSWGATPLRRAEEWFQRMPNPVDKRAVAEVLRAAGGQR